MVSKNHRMHLNPLYDRKTDLGQPTQFRKKNLKRVGEHSFMAQINARIKFVLKTFSFGGARLGVHVGKNL